MKSYYRVEMALTGGIYRDAQFTYHTLTELQQALEFELLTDLRKWDAGYLFSYDELPLEAVVRGRAKKPINLLPFITIHGANGVTFTLHEKGAWNNFERGNRLIGTDVVINKAFCSSALLSIDWGSVPVPPLPDPAEDEDEDDEEDEDFHYGFFDSESGLDDCDAQFRAEMEKALAIDPGWLLFNHGAVRALAESMHASGDYSSMPILGDALEEAGCANELMLWHCRGPAGVYTRGSWLVERIRRA
ncbi:MAG: hypothetical protein K2V38_11965 [Gemmataceae bacterium]|nr:hypothetical protein [Gemmataceae bacterium]